MEEGGEILTFLRNSLANEPGFKFSSFCNDFRRLKTNLERMNYVYQYTEKCKAYPVFKEDEKSDVESIRAREQGNEKFIKGNYREALDCYTRSVLNAKSKDIVALAYANRSAALFKLNLYRECLKDIERAFENNYPVYLKAKLEERQMCAITKKEVTNKYYEPVPVIPKSEKNSQIQCAKNCIKILKNEQYGRHVVATRNIKIGEIIAVESPYCVVMQEEIYAHCHECFELCYNMIPCNKCTKALYCSNICKDKAFETYHKYECPILLTLDLPTMDFPKRLALKIIFISRNEWDENSSDQFETTEYRSDRFREIYNFLSHVEKRPVENILARTGTACAFFHIIKNHTSFLQDYSNEDRLKEILLSIVLNCGTNTVDLNELSPTETNLLRFYEITSLATAVYPFFTMFNHSCWPNICRQFYGSSMVLRACSSVKQGDQCFVSYGPRYGTHSKEYRQNFLLKRQFFTCTCRACQENWPINDYMEQQLRTTFVNLGNADVDSAKQKLRQLLKQAKEAEKAGQSGQDFGVKLALTLCYNIFGNKRRF